MIGRSIGNYKIVRAIGEGGMGTVYLAEHPMIGKRVAVKMLRPDLGTDPGLVSRFFQEARAVNEIRHPNIVDISDYGKTEDGIVYLVMELLEGRSLRDRLNAEGALPLDEAVTISRQVCDALAAAHRVGIVHRDLKPDNVFLLQDPAQPGGLRSKLFDFGVAKLLGEQEKQVGHKTIAGSVVGTPYYMSPEQALCQDVGAASDIYSMGVMMFEMVTGHVPFAAEQLVILLNAILKQPAPPASEFRPEVPPFLDRLILRCLEKDPGGRPQTMEEVVALLNAGAAELAGESVAFGETMAAGPGLAGLNAPRASGASPVTMAARTSAPRARTTVAPQTAPARTTETTPVLRTVAPHDGVSAAAGVGRSGSARQGGISALGIGPRLAELPSRGAGCDSLGHRRSGHHRGKRLRVHGISSLCHERSCCRAAAASACAHARANHSRLRAPGGRGDTSQRWTVAGHHPSRRHPPRQRPTDQLPFSPGRVHRGADTC